MIMLGNDRMIYRRGASQSATFVVAASDSLHQGYADYVCDGVDDQVEINAACDGGHRKVVLRAGHYNVNATGEAPWYNAHAIGLDDYTTLEMESGVVITLGDAQNCSVIGNKDQVNGNTNIHIKGGYIDGNKANQTEYKNEGETPDMVGHAVLLYNCTDSSIMGMTVVDTWMHSLMLTQSSNCIIANNWVYNSGMNHVDTTYESQSGILLWDSSNNNVVCNNHVLRTDAAADQPRACRAIYNSGISSGNRIIGNIIDGWQGDDGFGGYGIFFMNACADIDIGNNKITNGDVGIMGDVTSTEGLTNVNIHDNHINVDKSPIWLEYAEAPSIVNNHLYSGQSWGFCIDLRNCTDVNVVGNQILYGWHGSITDCVGGRYRGNIGNTEVKFDDSSNLLITENGMSDITVLPTASIIRNNVNFVTENSGTATLLNGATSIDVDHGLDVTPSAGDIMVTPAGSLGSASFFYIDTYTATQFTIHVDVDPGANVDFAWKAIVL